MKNRFYLLLLLLFSVISAQAQIVFKDNSLSTPVTLIDDGLNTGGRISYTGTQNGQTWRLYWCNDYGLWIIVAWFPSSVDCDGYGDNIYWFNGYDTPTPSVNVSEWYVNMGGGGLQLYSAQTITGISVSSGNTTYLLGNQISVAVTFSGIVNVSGSPTLPLTVGSTTRTASYSSGSGTNTLTFTYTVQSGDLDNNGIDVNSPISGTIRDAAGANPVLSFPNANFSGVLVNAVAPTVTSVYSSTANGTYGINSNIDVTVNFSSPVTVTGTPSLALNSGGTANYTSGSGTSSLTFSYQVTEGQSSADLDAASTVAMSLNGGTIKDGSGNAATLTLPAPGAGGSLGANKNIVVDGVRPTLGSVIMSSSNAIPGLAKPGDVITLTFTPSKQIAPPLVTIAGTNASVNPIGSNSWFVTYTMTPLDAEGAIPFNISYTDMIGNAGVAVTTTTSGYSIIFDKTAPAVPTGFTATPGNNTIVLAWSANNDPDVRSYRLYGGTTADASDFVLNFSSNTSGYTHSGLTNGQTYYYRLTALDAVGNESDFTTASGIPIGSQTITFAAVSVAAYGDADFDPGATSTGSTSIPITYSSSDEAIATIVAGKVHMVKAGTVTITASKAGDAGNQAAASVTQTLTINKKGLTVNLNLSPLITKEYDGLATFLLPAPNYSLVGLVGNDIVSVSGTASYDTKNVGWIKTITVSNFLLSGANADNYILNTANATTLGQITPKSVMVSLTGNISKVYDGNTLANIQSSNITLNGLIAGEIVTVNRTQADATYFDKNVGSGKFVSVSGFYLDGVDASNYQLASSNVSGAVGVITSRSVIPSYLGSLSKTYDGNATATISVSHFSLLGSMAGDDVHLGSSFSAFYDDKNVGNSKSASISGLSLAGADADNYTLSSSAINISNAATISAASLTVSLQGTVSKSYDGNSTAPVAASNYLLSGVVVGDDVQLSSSATAMYDNKNAGTGKMVIVSGISISGNDAGNYQLTSTQANAAIGNISAAQLTASLQGSIIKTYDGNSSASLNAGNYALGGVITGDDVSLNNPSTGNFDSKNVGTGKTVTVNGLAINGADAGNYNLALTNANAAIGSINAAEATASLQGSVTKVYDGNTNASLTSANYLLTGIVANDDVSLNDPAAGSFDDKNAGAGKSVTVNNLTMTGVDASNYTLASTSVNAPIGSINVAQLTTSLQGNVNKVYDGNTNAALTSSNYLLSGLINNDDITLNNPATGSFDNKNAGTGKIVTVNNLAITGTDAVNYALASTSTSASIGSINAAQIAASLRGNVSKLYDGNTSATLTSANYQLNGALNADDVALNNPTTGNFDNKNAGIRKVVTVNGLALSGNDASNYILAATSANGAIGAITAAQVTAVLQGNVTKTYDGNTTAQLTPTNYVLGGVLYGDDVVLNNPNSGNFDNKNAGTSKNVTVNNLAITGTDAVNYALASTSTSASIGSINAAQIAASLRGNVSKLYDGNTSATLTSANYQLNGALNADDVALNNPTTGNFDNKNAGIRKVVTVNGLALSGNDASNYILAATSANGAIGAITAAQVTAVLQGNVTKTYDGNISAALTSSNYTLTGILNSDDVALNNPTIGSFDNKNAGTAKVISVNGLTVNGLDAANYVLNANEISAAIGAINPAALAVTASDKNFTYSDQPFNGGNGVSYSGFINGENETSLNGTVTYSGNSQGAINAGSYAIVPGGYSSFNYHISYLNGTLTINPATLTVKANNQVKDYNTTNPDLTISYNGFVGGDSENSLTSKPTASTTAVKSSPVGTYAINVSGGAALNYVFDYVPGTLTVSDGAPSGISLALSALTENSAVGTLAGTMTAASPDVDASYTFALVSGNGDLDNHYFSILNNKLVTGAVLNYEKKSSYTIRVRATTQNGSSIEKSFMITLLDVNEAPTLSQPGNVAICYTTTAQNVQLSGITAGEEQTQTVTLFVRADNASLFNSLEVSSVKGNNASLSYTLKSGASGTAIVFVTVKDNGGVEYNGTDSLVKSFRITVNALPEFELTSDKGLSISKGDQTQLTVAPTTGSVKWSPTTGLDFPLSFSPKARLFDNTIYSATVTNAAGCFTTKSLNFTVTEDFKITPKVMITPNGDGINDYFVIGNIDAYPDNQLQVFDRSGKLIYEKRNYRNDWNGLIRNTPLTTDTYFYVLTIKGKVVKKGAITVIQ